VCWTGDDPGQSITLCKLAKISGTVKPDCSAYLTQSNQNFAYKFNLKGYINPEIVSMTCHSLKL
jgi:hypothetical protein